MSVSSAKLDSQVIRKIAELIQEIGYRASIGDGFIKSAMSGWAVLVFLFPNQTLQMYFGISRDSNRDFDFEHANEFNKKNRFVKCYLVEESIRFEHDFYFDESRADAKLLLERIFLRWEAAVGIANEALKNAQKEDPATSS